MLIFFYLTSMKNRITMNLYIENKIKNDKNNAFIGLNLITFHQLSKIKYFYYDIMTFF